MLERLYLSGSARSISLHGDRAVYRWPRTGWSGETSVGCQAHGVTD